MFSNNKKFLLLALLSSPAMASGMFKGGGFDTTKYCISDEHGSPRQTHIIIDQGSIKPGDRNWFKDIDGVLPSSFLGSEKVSVHMISPSGQSNELMSACYPNIALLPEGGLLSASPDRVVGEDKSKFTQLLRQAISHVHTQAQQSAPSRNDSKDLARSIFYTANAVRLNQTPIRLVIYANGMQDGGDVKLTALNSAKAAEEAGVALAEKTRNDFNNSTVYFHGVDASLQNRDNLKTFWQSYFQSSSAHLKSYDLNLPAMNNAADNSPALARSYSGELNVNGQRQLVNLRIEIPKGRTRGDVNNVFMTMNNSSHALAGNFSCNEVNNSCNYQLKVTQRHPNSPLEIGDDLVLDQVGKEVNGQIGSLDPSVIDEESNQQFLFPVSLTQDSFLRF